MTSLKVLLSAVLLCCFSLVSNPVYAVGDYNNWTWNNDIDYYKTAIDESGLYADSTLTDWHWMLAGDPNNGDTTDDGFCFMYDGGNYGGTPFAIYNAIDITKCAFYNNPTYANIEWYSFSDLNLIAEPDPGPIGIYQDQQSFVGVVDDKTNIFGTGSSYWSGCFATGDSPTWGNIGGGECPIINNGSGQINWGYMQQTLTQISAIDTALKNAGIETYGYTYSWMVKNADANNELTNGAAGQDTLTVTLSIKDNRGNTVYQKEFDYSYWIDNWTQFSGDENFDTPFDLKTLDSIMLQVTGQDVGNWEGYYGPEFNNPDVKLKYRPIIVDNTEQMLFDQMCQNDPTYDMNCPGYQNAIIEQMNTQTAAADLTTTGATEVVANDGSINVETVAKETAVQEEVISEEPIQETVNEQIAEVTQEATQEASSEEPQESSQAEMADNSTPSEKEPGGGLNAAQLMALDIAAGTTAAAESTASSQALQSTGSGLSASGGVSSNLTSDGVSNSNGTLTDFASAAIGGPGESNDQSSSQSGMSDGSGSSVDSMNSGSADVSGSEIASIDLTNTESDSNAGIGSTDLQSGNLESITGSIDIANMNTGTSSDTIETTDVFAQLSENDISTDINSIQSNEALDNNTIEIAAVQVDLTDLNNPVTQIINEVTNKLIIDANKLAEDIVEESAEESYEEQNAKEDSLVEQALAGDESEDAQAALLGYNPNFRAYQQPQLPSGEFYKPKDIYQDQKNYDNPNQRLFNGASDTRHREMVRQQYELGN